MEETIKVKICMKCGMIKTASPRGVWYCKVCTKVRADVWRAKSKCKIQAIGRVYQYKLTDEMFKARLEAQENKCAVCRVLFTLKVKPYIDHDHSCCMGQVTCGKCVRGILCNGCNTLIGKIETRPGWMRAVSKYLDSYIQ